MLQAMNTGHDGSLTTTHANSPREALSRLETLVLMAGLELPIRAIREQIAGSIHLLVQQSRLSDGSRKVTAIAEVTGIDDDGEVEIVADLPVSADRHRAQGKGGGGFPVDGVSSFVPQRLHRPRTRQTRGVVPVKLHIGVVDALKYAGFTLAAIGILSAVYFFGFTETPVSRAVARYEAYLDRTLRLLFRPGSGKAIVRWQGGVLATVLSVQLVVVDVPYWYAWVGLAIGGPAV